MELIPAQKQRVWKWPAATNFSLGGMGTGLYLAALLVPLPQGGNWVGQIGTQGDWFRLLFLAALFKILGPALVAAGFLALTTEAGRPQRGLNLLRHLRRSWMSRETLAAALFIPLAGLDWLFPQPALQTPAALAAIALMICQGMMVYRARGVVTWNNPLVPFFFLTCGLATGSGLLLVVLALANGLLGTGLILVPAVLGALAAGVLNLSLWLIYTDERDEAFQKSISSLRQPRMLGLMIGAGQLLPIALLALTLILRPSEGIQSAMLFPAGLALVLGGVRQKFGLVLEAGYLRSIALPIPRFQASGEQQAMD